MKEAMCSLPAENERGPEAACKAGGASEDRSVRGSQDRSQGTWRAHGPPRDQQGGPCPQPSLEELEWFSRVPTQHPLQIAA